MFRVSAFDTPEEQELAQKIYRQELWEAVDSGTLDTDQAIAMVSEKVSRVMAVKEISDAKRGTYAKPPHFKFDQPVRGGCSGLSMEQRATLESERLGR